MTNTRRSFLERASLALATAGAGRTHTQRFNMSGFAAPKLDTVRVGIIGLGNRGPNHVAILRRLEGVEIRALCDLRPERTALVAKTLEGTAHKPTLYSGGPSDWKRLCEQKDLDLIYITTPYYMHASMAVYAMECGKHAASEVPIASTIEDCWKLVHTAERTRRHCMMLENYAYGPFQVLTLNMARQGYFGEIVHGEAAYNTSKMSNNFGKNFYWDMWWLKLYAAKRGNIYPTHGLGSVAQIMNINRGDRFDFLVSVESADFQMQATARELAAKDDFYRPFADRTYRGNMNTSIVRTVKGRTIMVQHDATSPRGPHSTIHCISGTKGMALEYPLPARISNGLKGWLKEAEYQEVVKQYTPEITRRIAEIARQIKAGHGGTDLLEDWHLIDCLRHGLPLDQDVYDGVAWSSLVPLTQWSVLNNSNSIKVPDFTAGSWKTNQPNMDINLTKGGGSTKILI